VPWKWRRRYDNPAAPGVFVELLVSGSLLITPEREKLSPSELEWVNEDALPALWIEWCEAAPLR
jgi:hypothetical protein